MSRSLIGAVCLAGLVLFAPAATAATTISYTYDARGRVVAVVYTGGPLNGVRIEYTYVSANNLVRKKVTGA